MTACGGAGDGGGGDGLGGGGGGRCAWATAARRTTSARMEMYPSRCDADGRLMKWSEQTAACFVRDGRTDRSSAGFSKVCARRGEFRNKFMSFERKHDNTAIHDSK